MRTANHCCFIYAEFISKYPNFLLSLLFLSCHLSSKSRLRFFRNLSQCLSWALLVLSTAFRGRREEQKERLCLIHVLSILVVKDYGLSIILLNTLGRSHSTASCQLCSCTENYQFLICFKAISLYYNFHLSQCALTILCASVPGSFIIWLCVIYFIYVVSGTSCF